MIIPILTGLLIGIKRRPKQSKNMEDLAKAAILAVSKKYGQDAAEVLEKLYRLETDHFKSGNFREAKGAGMEATTAAFPYGWSLAKFWNANPTYRPNGVIRRKENQTGKTKMFITFPTVIAGVMTAAEVLRGRNWNAGAWYSNNEADRARYNAAISKIKSRFFE